MKKVQYYRYGASEELRLEEAPVPVPTSGEVRVRVKAASYNPMDGKIRRGEMRMLSGFRFPRGLGHDFSGVVETVGPGVRRLKAGDEVFGVLPIAKAGAFAEYVVTEEKNLEFKPPSVSFEQATAMTVVGLTAWTGLVAKAKLTTGKSVFVNGCLGGVGRSAVQIGRMVGADIVGSCRAPGREDALRLGVSDAADYRGFDAAMHRGRFDVVFDTAGALTLRQCDTMLKPGGMSLHIVPTFSKMLGCLLSSRHNLVFGNPTQQSLAGVANAAERGNLAPEIGRVVRLTDAIQSIAELERANSIKGKLVIVPPDG